MMTHASVLTFNPTILRKRYFLLYSESCLACQTDIPFLGNVLKLLKSKILLSGKELTIYHTILSFNPLTDDKF